MSLVDRAFGDLKHVDVRKTAQVNVLRWVTSGVTVATLLIVTSGAPITLLFSMPFAMGMAFGFGLVARVLAKIGIPFAGLFEMLMRVALMAGDWLLHLVLGQFGEQLGLPYRFGWCNFALALFVTREGEAQKGEEAGTEDSIKGVIQQAANKKR